MSTPAELTALRGRLADAMTEACDYDLVAALLRDTGQITQQQYTFIMNNRATYYAGFNNFIVKRMKEFFTDSFMGDLLDRIRKING